MTALVAGTFDTKGAELSYIADLIETAGLNVQTADLSTAPAPSFGKTRLTTTLYFLLL